MESCDTTKGEATIPKAIRDDLRLKWGTGQFFIHPDGTASSPELPVSALRGIVNPRR